jgi:hypothetical protein
VQRQRLPQALARACYPHHFARECRAWGVAQQPGRQIALAQRRVRCLREV